LSLLHRGSIRQFGTGAEALDTLILAMAAAMHPSLRINTMHEADWQPPEQNYQPGTPPSAGEAKRELQLPGRSIMPTSAAVKR
jgi:hypothetical protein